MTFAHLAMSRWRKAPNSAGLMVIGSAPWRAQACWTAGLTITLAISAFRRSTTSLGVPAGAMTPSQMVAS
jgi:hypothetical protein